MQNGRTPPTIRVFVQLKQYVYWEYKEEDIGQSINCDILFVDSLDKWLDIRRELGQSTYEGYCYRVVHIKEYSEPRKLKVRDISSRVIDNYFQYELDYGKIDKKLVGGDLLQ